VTRARSLALLVAGCVLAAAAAGNGALLDEHPAAREPGFLTLLGLRRLGRLGLRARRRDGGGTPGALARWLDLVVGGLVLVVATVVLAVALWRVARLLVRLARLRFADPAASRATTEYDREDESDADADTALRDRVRAELNALSADLDEWPDPREAVIACYVRMERALADAGSPRRATESPLELVRRVLAEHHVPEPDVRRLTDLFTEARFSGHPVTDEMRGAARRSLAAVADALAVPA
jgi:hypothetical protein